MIGRQLIFSFSALAAVFAVTVVLLKILIPVLRSHKIGQKINDIGPRWHKNKEGTPIMGGISFIVPSFLLFAGIAVWAALSGRMREFLPSLLAAAMAILNGAVGFVDDYVKLIKKRNKGLSAIQKLIFQFVIAAAFVAAAALLGVADTALRIPFTDKSVELGFFYYVFAAVLIVGMVNAVNLTDGIDGLASSVTCVYGILFLVYSLVSRIWGISALSAAVIGGTAGFLVYNFYPARIFMGDTGSLFLGGMVAGLAFAAGNPLIVLIGGLIYVIETASVILQVGYFKLTHGKRLFLMSPIHHHFEKCGWGEIKIVAVFSAVTLAACVLAWFGL